MKKINIGVSHAGLLYALSILTGAFLVFQIQPIAGKYLLPYFGGGASVWTACMFFFQTMLLAGYGYAHVLTTHVSPRRQPALHGLLLLASLPLLPLSFLIDGSALSTSSPGPLIWMVLLVSIGFPFVMLASTAPLVQRWSSLTRPGHSPYRLYALSNAGALLALVTYPFLIEPLVSLNGQTVVWSIGYAIFVLVTGAVCAHVWSRRIPVAETVRNEREPAGAKGHANRWTLLDALLTIVLSACGVVMLLAITSQMTQNVAPVPFLWILPLVGFLFSYIVCFSGQRWYDRTIWGSLFLVAASTLIVLDFFASSFAIIPVIVAYHLVLFCICMVCHGELYRLRPNPRRLSTYYLLIALGGALGGAFVSIAAPMLFTRYWEGLISVFIIYLVLGVAVLRRTRSTTGITLPGPAAGSKLERWVHGLFVAGWIGGIVLFPTVVMSIGSLAGQHDIASVRNFYGLLSVRDRTNDDMPRRVLVDGTTIHGFQLLDDSRHSVPTSYYARDTGIGLVLERIGQRPSHLNAGFIGLGTGTLAAYGRVSDVYRFYELNPAVANLAQEYFSFLGESAATVDIVLGDGRISLAREYDQSGSREYDVLVVDAFSSDSIPVHLLTLEAQRLYWRHLKTDGVLAFHVTNNYVDLAPVIANVAAELGKQALLVRTAAETGVTSVADWMVVSNDPWPIPGAGTNGIIATPMQARPGTRTWTDNYSDLLGIVRR